MDAEHDTSEAASCCDGTGWTGDSWRRCIDHYDPPAWPMPGSGGMPGADDTDPGHD